MLRGSEGMGSAGWDVDVVGIGLWAAIVDAILWYRRWWWQRWEGLWARGRLVDATKTKSGSHG